MSLDDTTIGQHQDFSSSERVPVAAETPVETPVDALVGGHEELLLTIVGKELKGASPEVAAEVMANVEETMTPSQRNILAGLIELTKGLRTTAKDAMARVKANFVA